MESELISIIEALTHLSRKLIDELSQYRAMDEENEQLKRIENDYVTRY